MTARRPIVMGIVGDSAAGKTTLTSGIARILGPERVTRVCTDDYHKFDRAERAKLGITPLHPDCNYMDIMELQMERLHYGQPILKPVYDHTNGTLVRPEYVVPREFVIVEGLLGFHSPVLRQFIDVKVYLDPPEEVRRVWKVKRDTAKRGYTEEQVRADLDDREPDSAQFIRPQERHSDLVIKFMESEGGDPNKLDAQIVLRETLPHPDLTPFLSDGENGITLIEEGPDPYIRIPGDIEHERAEEIQEAIWKELHFASHLRSDRLGEFTIGDEVNRSDSLALVQLLVLYHMATARAAVSMGGEGARSVHKEEAEAENGGEADDGGEKSD